MTPTCWPVSSRIVPATSRRASLVRASRTSCAPDRAISIANAAPSPRLAPVIAYFCFEIRISFPCAHANAASWNFTVEAQPNLRSSVGWPVALCLNSPQAAIHALHKTVEYGLEAAMPRRMAARETMRTLEALWSGACRANRRTFPAGAPPSIGLMSDPPPAWAGLLARKGSGWARPKLGRVREARLRKGKQEPYIYWIQPLDPMSTRGHPA